MKAQYKYYNINGKNYAEHRIIIEQYLNRKVKEDEDVHHINGNGFDNRIGNLQIITHKQHSRFHALQRSVKVDCICPTCNKHFSIPQYEYRKRLKRSKSGKIFCSGECAPSPPFKRILDIDGLIIRELNNGLTGYAIAKKYNLCKKTVYNHMKRSEMVKGLYFSLGE